MRRTPLADRLRTSDAPLWLALTGVGLAYLAAVGVALGTLPTWVAVAAIAIALLTAFLTRRGALAWMADSALLLCGAALILRLFEISGS